MQQLINKVPSKMQAFSIMPMKNKGLYNGNVLVSGWDGIKNSTYTIQLGIKSDTLDQGYLITSDLIEKRLPNLLSNTQDPKPEIPEVFIEISPDDKKPLEPQQQELIITDLGQSPGSYIPGTITPDQRESKVLKDNQKFQFQRK